VDAFSPREECISHFNGNERPGAAARFAAPGKKPEGVRGQPDSRARSPNTLLCQREKPGKAIDIATQPTTSQAEIQRRSILRVNDPSPGVAEDWDVVVRTQPEIQPPGATK